MTENIDFDLAKRSFLKNLAIAGVGAGATFIAKTDVPRVSAAGEYPHINVKDYGATGNGVTNDTTAFQNALNAAGNAGGGIVFAPRGNYRINGTLLVPAHVTLEGVFQAPTAWSQYNGTTLLPYGGKNNPGGTPFITLHGSNAGLKGLTIFYPEQTTSIIPYPWTIRGGSPGATATDNLTIQDVLIVNPYRAVDFGTYPCGRHFINGLYGYPLNIGIVVDQCYDIGRIQNVHFWPFWNTSNTPFLSAVANSAFALILKKAEWQIVHNFFAFGYHVGVQFVKGAGGTGPNGQFSNLNLDVANVGLDIHSIAPYGVQITNLNAVSAGVYNQPIRRAIWARNSGDPIGPLSIQNASFWGGFLNEVILWQAGQPLQISSSIFRDWKPGWPAIIVQGGRATIQGNYFQDQIGKSVQIGSSAQQVIVIGNQLLGNPVESFGPSHLRMIANNL